MGFAGTRNPQDIVEFPESEVKSSHVIPSFETAEACRDAPMLMEPRETCQRLLPP